MDVACFCVIARTEICTADGLDEVGEGKVSEEDL